MEYYNPIFLQQAAPLLLTEYHGVSDTSNALLNFIKGGSVKHGLWDNKILESENQDIRYRLKITQPENHESDEFLNNFSKEVVPETWLKMYFEEKPFGVIVIYSLGSEDAEDAEIEIAENILSLRTRCQRDMTNLWVIITANGENEFRFEKLHHLTGDEKYGNLHLLRELTTSKTEAEMFWSNIHLSMKKVIFNFYSEAEKKLKQQEKEKQHREGIESKMLTAEVISQVFDTVNLFKAAVINEFLYSQKMHQGLRYLEIVYQRLIDVLEDGFGPHAGSDSVTAFDAKLYKDIRILVDVVAFRIVRGYLSLNETLLGLKKHYAHIANVKNHLEGKGISEGYWLSAQYQWLADLIKFVPAYVFEYNNMMKHRSRVRNSHVAKFFGGVRLIENYHYSFLFHPTLLYMKASTLLGQGLENISILDYMYAQEDGFASCMKRIDLLFDGKNFLHNHATDNHAFVEATLDKYISWIVSEEYAKLEKDGNLDKTSVYLEDSLMRENKTKDIGNSILLFKLFQAYVKQGEHTKGLRCALKLSSIEVSELLAPKYPPQELFDIPSKEVNVFEENKSRGVFYVDALLASPPSDEHKYCGVYNQNISHFDPCMCQITVKPNISLQALIKFFKGKDIKAELLIDEVYLEFSMLDSSSSISTLSNVHLTRNKQKSLHTTLEKIELDFEEKNASGSFNYRVADDSLNGEAIKVFQFEQKAMEKGLLAITSIRLSYHIVISSGGENLIVYDQSIHSFNHSDDEPESVKWIYQCSKNELTFDELERHPLRVLGGKPHAVRVAPIKADLRLDLMSDKIKTIALGEKLSLSFYIENKSKRDLDIEYEEMLLLPRVKVLDSNENRVLNVTTLVCWNGLKDDEPLSLTSLMKMQKRSTTSNLDLFFSTLERDVETSFESLEVYIQFQLILTLKKSSKSELQEESERQEVHEVAQYSYSLLQLPFYYNITIKPRYRNDIASDIPNPFLLDPAGNENGLLKTSRLWVTHLVFGSKLSALDNIDIVNISFSVESESFGSSVDLVDFPKGGSQDVSQLIMTSVAPDFSQKNTVIYTTARIVWKRQGSNIQNEFVTDKLRFVLPALDPRLLLCAKMQEDADIIKIKYIIENPTSKVFVFSTQLDTEEVKDKVNWIFDDPRNIVPLSIPNLPVLPYSKQVLSFYCRYFIEGKNDPLVLPKLNVSDINYKVALPTLPACNSITMRHDNILFWHNIS